MINTVLSIQKTCITVRGANGDDCTVSITLTPRRRYLTQATKRAILATGFLLHYGEEIATDKDIINCVIRSIRHEILLSLKEI